jgi:hypothetical protein
MTPRRIGWDFAQVRTSFLSDPEFQRLRGLARSDLHYLAAVGLWTVAIAQAWREDSENAGQVLTSYPGFPKGPDYLRSADLIREGDVLAGFAKWTEAVRRAREQDAERKRKGVQPTPAESGGVHPIPRGVGVGVEVERTPLPSPSNDEQNQPDITELHPITRQPRKRTPGVTEPVPTIPPILEGPFPEVTLSPSEMLDEDPFDATYGRHPRPKAVEWHDRLLKLYPGLVDAAMRQAISTDPDPATLLSRTEAILKADTRAAIAATTSAGITADVERQRAKRAAWEAESAGEPPFVPKPWHEIVAPKGSSTPTDHPAENRAKQDAERKADRSRERDPQPATGIGALLSRSSAKPLQGTTL